MINWIAGPWIWDATDSQMPCWHAPAGFTGVDMRPLPQQSQLGGTAGQGIFVGQVPLASIENRSDYGLLGQGSWYDIKPNAAQKARIPKRPGFSLAGEDLVGMILSSLTDGASPDGSDGPMPLVPTTEGKLELRLGPIQHSESFRWGGFHTAILRQRLRLDFALNWQDALAGRMRNAQHPRRLLSMMCDKYGVADWKEFVPAILQKDIPGTLPHETTYTDAFTRADSTGLGASWSLINAGSSADVVSNQARGPSATGGRNRYDSDLSSVDHEAQLTISQNDTVGAAAGPLCRVSSSADTCYAFLLDNTPRRRLFKLVAGTATQLTGDTTALPSTPYVVKVYVSGSTQKVYVSGAEVVALAGSDTAISGGLRGGIQAGPNATAGNRCLIDDWSVADLAASGILYTQLERGTRGILRGMYTRF